MTTPNELLTEVISTFEPLLYDDPAKLLILLKSSIEKYRDKAGFHGKVTISEQDNNDGGIDLPDYFRSIITASDSVEVYADADVVDGKIVVNESGWGKPPYTVHCLLDLSKSDFENDPLPEDSVSIIRDHLIILVSLQNSKRERHMCQSAGLPDDHIATEAEITEARKEIELDMKESHEILLPVMIM